MCCVEWLIVQATAKIGAILVNINPVTELTNWNMP
jgi:hypothetical protein